MEAKAYYGEEAEVINRLAAKIARERIAIHVVEPDINGEFHGEQVC